MFRSENAGQILNNDQPDRLNIEEQGPPTMSQDHTRVSTAPSPYVTAAALEDVKTSIQELRSILLLARGGALGEEANELGTDQRGRSSRRSGDIPGERNGDTAGIGAIPPPPPTVVPTGGSRIVRMQSPVTIIPTPRSRSSSRSRSSRGRPYVVQHPGPVIIPQSVAPPSPTQFVSGYSRGRLLSGVTNATGRELESVISDFSSIVIIATFLASVSIVMLDLARNIYDSPNLPKSSLNKAFNTILQVFASLALSFNLSVAIVAGSAASSQSLRLRLGQGASDFSRSQSLDTKLQLCTAMQYYGLLCLTVATGSIFALLLNSPYAVLMIIPVVGVVFYDSLFRGKVSSASQY